MTLLAESPWNQLSPPVILAIAGAFAVLGFAGLLPQPKGRAILLGGFFSAVALLGLAYFTIKSFGDPLPDLIGSILFYLFSAGSLGFGTVLVVQKNPARGAVAFAFVVLSTCGLFLLLAAPFLMAATVIIYAGAVIVTFLFVLMLSHAGGPSDENDRTRDPLLGSLAGFGFAGLVLIALYQTAVADSGPTPPLTSEDRAKLVAAAGELGKSADATTRDQLIDKGFTKATRDQIAEVVAGEGGRRTVQDRLRFADADPRTHGIIQQADALKKKNDAVFAALDNNLLGNAPDLDKAKRDLAGLRDDVVLMTGNGHLPARNVGTIGLLLYSEHLLSVELAGTLLLVATIGAVAIAGRKGVAA
jgi:NADH-quinone oxidoreductase subunit J